MKALMVTALLLLVCPNPLTAEEQKSDILILQKKAKQGDADAQYELGRMYGKGEGVEQDYTKAAEWFEKAAEQGHAEAQYNLGGLYFKGWGVAQDYTKAAEWFRKAAEQGHTQAKDALEQL